METRRISTGIKGLDEIIKGGIPEHQSYLLVGTAGTGKTIGSVQWLVDGEQKGEHGLYISLTEPFENVRRNVSNFGWDLDQLAFVDLNPAHQKEEEVLKEEYSVFSPGEVESTPKWAGIYEAVRRHQPERVAIDSLTHLRYLSTDDYQFRKQLQALVAFLRKQECTSILTFEPSELEKEGSVALAVDGIIRFHMGVSPQRLTGVRNVEVVKLRGSDFLSGYHSMRITDEGIRVFPRRIEEPSGIKPGATVLSSGIKELDGLIGGGLESGTSTILTGPWGVGKTTLGMQFMMQAAQQDQCAAVYTFGESVASIVTSCEELGMPVAGMQEQGDIIFRHISPMKLYPDEFLSLVRQDVEEGGCEVIMLDSLRGYGLAMEEFGSLRANLQNLITYLNSQEVISILTNELEVVTDNLTAAGVDINQLADTLLLLRYAEYRGRIIKAIACLKKRHSPLDLTLREMRITSEGGLEVGRELTGMRGLLTGLPSTVPANEAPGSTSREEGG